MADTAPNEDAEKKRGPGLGSRAPKIALRWFGLGVTEPWGHPSSFPLRGRWERPIPSCKWAPSSPFTGRCGSCWSATHAVPIAS